MALKSSGPFPGDRTVSSEPAVRWFVRGVKDLTIVLPVKTAPPLCFVYLIEKNAKRHMAHDLLSGRV